MKKRELTPEEKRAYAALARAFKRLREAQQKAEKQAARHREAKSRKGAANAS